MFSFKKGDVMIYVLCHYVITWSFIKHGKYELSRSQPKWRDRLTSNRLKQRSESFLRESIPYSRGNYYTFCESCAPSFTPCLAVKTQFQLTHFVSFHSASPRNTATQRENFAPFLSDHLINNFSLFFPLFFLAFPFF